MIKRSIFYNFIKSIYKFEIKFDIEKNKNEEKGGNKNQGKNDIANRGLFADIIEAYQRTVIRDICYHFYHFYIYIQYTSNF